jgi:hypothetical protein
MPGLWTGGGPQLVGVDAPVLIEAAKPQAPPPSPDPEPSTAPPTSAVREDDPGERAAPSTKIVPSSVGELARRSLAFGPSWLPSVGLLLAALASAVVIFFAERAIVGSGLPSKYAPLLPVVSIWFVLWIGEPLLMRRLASRELRRLQSLPWTFDLEAYLGLLDRDHLDETLRIDVTLVEPVAEASRSALGGSGRLGRATVRWTNDRALSIRFRTGGTRTWTAPLSRSSPPSNSHVHRWFRRRLIRRLQALHAARGIRAAAVHLD